jgi:hypothetical protein
MRENTPPRVNMSFLFMDAKRAQAFVAVIKNRFGLAAEIDDQELVHVTGSDTEDGDITDQVKALAHWCSATTPRDGAENIDAGGSPQGGNA